MPLIKECCCCDLEGGVMILGWLRVFGGTMSVIFGSLYLITIMLNDIDYVFKIIAFCTFLYALIVMISNIMLLTGISKKNHRMLLPWLVSDSLITFPLPIVVLIGGTYCYMERMAEMGTWIYVVGTPAAALHIFCWLCVFSLYQIFSKEAALNAGRRQDEIDILPTAPRATIKPPPYDHYDNV